MRPRRSRWSRLAGSVAGMVAVSLGTEFLGGGVPACRTMVPAGLVVAETWTASGSPYCVTGDIQVSLLTIEAGVEVLVDGPYAIDVLSTVTAAGSEDAPVVFRSRDPGLRWKGLHFRNTPAGSSFAHCVIEHSDDAGVTIVDAVPPLFSDCTFRANTKSGEGGAVDAIGVQDDLEFIRCLFADNTSTGHGGALHSVMAGGELRLVESLFVRNTANPATTNGNIVGGAVYLEGGDGHFIGTRFEANRANSRCSSSFGCDVTGRGGAVYKGGDGLLTIEACAFESNRTHAQNAGNCFFGGSTVSHGAALYIASGQVVVRNSVLTCNRTTGSSCGYSDAGGGIFVRDGGQATLEQCTLARNADSTGAHVAGGGTLTIINSILNSNNGGGVQIGGSATVRYSNVQNLAGLGFGNDADDHNADLNPVFRGPGCSVADLAIAPGSPSIDAGDPESPPDGCLPPGLGEGRSDMGAFGGAGNCQLAAAPVRDCNANSWPDASDIAAERSTDCNGNGIPDECDLATGELIDSDGDGAPDACECGEEEPCPESQAEYRLEDRPGGCLAVVLLSEAAVRGGEIGLVFDGSALALRSVEAGAGLPEPEVFATDLDPLSDGCTLPETDAGVTIAWIPSETPGLLLAPGEHEVTTLCFDRLEGAPACAPVRFADCLGDDLAPVQNIVTGAGGESQAALTRDHDVCLEATDSFRRGDANGDRVFDISDAVVILTCLFLDVACRECQDASDANDDGAVDMSDATYLVNWRFGSRVAPPPPFPACGADPTADDLESTCGDPGCD